MSSVMCSKLRLLKFVIRIGVVTAVRKEDKIYVKNLTA
jgi:hypothetical protein